MSAKIYNFTPEMDQQILAVYREGIGKGQVKRLAEKFGVHIRTVSRRAQLLLDTIEIDKVTQSNRLQPKAPPRPAAIERMLFERYIPSFLLGKSAVDNPV
jgi:hypothetical protein